MSKRNREPRIDPGQLRAAVKRLDEQLAKARADDAKLQGRCNEYEELRGVLEDLPEKVTHPVMVPFGPLAFFEGHLEHTNEVLVQLSSEWFALKTAKHALGTVDRRVARVKREQATIAKEVRELEQKRRLAVGERAHASDIPGATVTEDEEGFLDIREPYVEDGAGAQQASTSNTRGEDEMCASGTRENVSALDKLRELERMEEEDELDELKELDDIVERYEGSSREADSGGGDLSAFDMQGASAPNAAPVGTAGYPEVRSPSDLYQLMSSADSAVRGSAGSADVLGRQEESVQLPASGARQVDRAFTGEIREHEGGQTQAAIQSSIGESSSGSTSKPAAVPKRISKFKSDRQRATGGSGA